MENAADPIAKLRNSPAFSDRLKGMILSDVMGGRYDAAIQRMRNDNFGPEDVRKWIADNGFIRMFIGKGKMLDELSKKYDEGKKDTADWRKNLRTWGDPVDIAPPPGEGFGLGK